MNIGCGAYYDRPHMWGWIRIDTDPAVKPDIVASILDLPLYEGIADRVYLGHILEHLDERDVIPALIEVKRVLHPNGTLMVVGPCIDLAVKTGNHAAIDTVLHNGPPTGEFHRWVPTARRTFELVREVFPDVGQRVPNWTQIARDGWPIVSNAEWQFCLVTKRWS